jgi:branched-chain amino acid transport system permease protein
LAFWIVNLLNGLSLAMLLFILASGLTLIFGLMRIVNMAHGSFYLLGGYLGVAVVERTGSFALALAVSFVAIAVIGIAMQRLCLSRLYKEELPQALLTLGFLFIFADIAYWVWGGNPVMIATPPALQGALGFGGISYPAYRLFLIGVGAAVALALWLVMEKTRFGAVVRAGMDDEEMVRGLGINVPLVFAAVFALGAGLAAIGGVLGGPLFGIFPGADFEVALLAFAVVTVGGLGSIKGAFAGSLLVGLVDNFANVWFPQFSLFSVFVPMVIVLAVRPMGLMGRA